MKTTYHIHWPEQSQPGPMPFPTMTDALLHALQTCEGQPFSIWRIRAGFTWPRGSGLVYHSNGGYMGNWSPSVDAEAGKMQCWEVA